MRMCIELSVRSWPQADTLEQRDAKGALNDVPLHELGSSDLTVAWGLMPKSLLALIDIVPSTTIRIREVCHQASDSRAQYSLTPKSDQTDSFATLMSAASISR
jgi:hypothetical protein